MSVPKPLLAEDDELKANIEKALNDLFYGAFEAGGDEVLLRQFENDPPAKHRYAERCIKDLKSIFTQLISKAEIRGVERFIKYGWGEHCKTKDTVDFVGEDLTDARCSTCEMYEHFDEWKATQPNQLKKKEDSNE